MSGKAFLRRQLPNKGLKEVGEWKEQREQQVQWLRGPGMPEVWRKREEA